MLHYSNCDSFRSLAAAASQCKRNACSAADKNAAFRTMGWPARSAPMHPCATNRVPCDRRRCRAAKEDQRAPARAQECSRCVDLVSHCVQSCSDQIRSHSHQPPSLAPANRKSRTTAVRGSDHSKTSPQHPYAIVLAGRIELDLTRRKLIAQSKPEVADLDARIAGPIFRPIPGDVVESDHLAEWPVVFPILAHIGAGVICVDEDQIERRKTAGALDNHRVGAIAPQDRRLVAHLVEPLHARYQRRLAFVPTYRAAREIDRDNAR